MSDGDQRAARMAGCACLGKGGLILFALVLVFGLLLTPTRCSSDGPGHIKLKTLSVLITLREGLHSYEVEYNHYPVDQSRTTGDLKTTSRGLLLSLLMGMNSLNLNKKEIQFCAFQAAKNQRNGIWQDGKDWVLSDRWGHEYQILIDTDSDGKIANPDIRESTQQPYLHSTIVIFSAGPDGNPSTWEDNIKSWQQ